MVYTEFFNKYFFYFLCKNEIFLQLPIDIIQQKLSPQLHWETLNQLRQTCKILYSSIQLNFNQKIEFLCCNARTSNKRQ